MRSAVKRVGRDHRFRVMRESDASPQLVEELNKIRERWRGKAPERGFTMELGGGVRGQSPDFLLAVAFRARASSPTASCGSCPATATTRAGRST